MTSTVPMLLLSFRTGQILGKTQSLLPYTVSHAWTPQSYYLYKRRRRHGKNNVNTLLMYLLDFVNLSLWTWIKLWLCHIFLACDTVFNTRHVYFTRVGFNCIFCCFLTNSKNPIMVRLAPKRGEADPWLKMWNENISNREYVHGSLIYIHC